MPYQYTNRRGEVYHLQATTRRSGATVYSLTRKLTGTPVDDLPEGFEVWELPDRWQVVLRKSRPSAILPLEKQLAETTLRNVAKLEHFIVEVNDNDLVVWTPDTDKGEIERMATDFGLGMLSVQQFIERRIQRGRYTRMMRFVLSDPVKRSFEVHRWCFLGGIDGWHFLNSGKPLIELLERYTPHLADDTFFDLT